jgi:hypothetical protein
MIKAVRKINTHKYLDTNIVSWTPIFYCLSLSNRESALKKERDEEFFWRNLSCRLAG